MKMFRYKTSLSAFLFLLLSFLFFGCQKSKNVIHQIQKTQKIDVGKALHSGFFRAIVDSSIIYVRTINDDTMPVKGSLNLKMGRLNINPNAKSLLDLVVDMNSWDSGLILRDDRVMRIFFGTDLDRNRVATFQVKGIDAKKLVDFKKSKKIMGLKVSGDLVFHGVTLPVEAVLNVTFNNMGRLVVTTQKPIPLKISDLKLNGPLKKLMIVCDHKSVDDVVTLTVHLEFEPTVIPGDQPTS